MNEWNLILKSRKNTPKGQTLQQKVDRGTEEDEKEEDENKSATSSLAF